jgi:DNA repair exonuclease SbcCD ATPase subunit
MDKLVFETPDQVQQAMNSGNRQKELETVNAVLAGNIEIKSTQPIPTSVVDNQETQNQVVENKPEEIKPTEDIVPTEEVDKERKYQEFLLQKEKEEKELYLIELKKKEDEFKREKIAREELEKKLQELSDLKKLEPSTSVNTQTDDDDSYVAEYEKRTRKMVEDLKSQVGDSPVVRELVDKIQKIESEYETRKQEVAKLQQEEVRKKQEDKVFDSIRELQMKYPELQTQKDIKEIDKDYLNFRKNIAFLVKAKNSLDVDRAIKDYYNNGEVKKLAEARGIKDVPDYNKYTTVADLIDLKNGIQRDPITGEERQIQDEFGNPVRYRSLDEVYKLSRYYDDLTNARQRTLKEVSKKLETIEQSPVTLRPEQIGEFTTGFSLEQEQEILNWKPEVWVNDPAKKKMVEEVYLKRGLEMPRYRGRK